jgi:hypothetical protein
MGWDHCGRGRGRSRRVARKLAKTIWHLLTKQERFAPARRTRCLWSHDKPAIPPLPTTPLHREVAQRSSPEVLTVSHPMLVTGGSGTLGHHPPTEATATEGRT